MKNIDKAKSCNGAPNIFLHFLPNGLLARRKSMLSLNLFSKQMATFTSIILLLNPYSSIIQAHV